MGGDSSSSRNGNSASACRLRRIQYINIEFLLGEAYKKQNKNAHLFPYMDKIDLRRRTYTKYTVNHKYKLWQIRLFAMCEWE